LSEEILGEVAMVELPGRKWTMRFDGSTIVALNGIGIVLSCRMGGPCHSPSSLNSLAKITLLSMRHI